MALGWKEYRRILGSENNGTTKQASHHFIQRMFDSSQQTSLFPYLPPNTMHDV